MIKNLMTAVFGTRFDRERRRIQPIVDAIHAEEEKLKDLGEDELKAQTARFRARLTERHIDLKLTDAAREHLIQVGYDPAYGARPLKRAIQKEVETPLARMLVAGEIRDGKTVHLDVRKGEMVFEVESPKAVRAS